MQIWKNKNKKVKIQLTISSIKGLPTEGLLERDSNDLTVKIEWTGNKRRSSYLSKQVVQRNCTSKKNIQSDGSVNWDEEFSHDCKLKRIDSQHFSAWEINLEVHGSGQESKSATSVLAKVRINIAQFVSPDKSSNGVIAIRIKYGKSAADAMLTVGLSISEMQTTGTNGSVHPFSRSISSCIRIHNPSFREDALSVKSDASLDQESELTYKNLASPNHLHPGDGIIQNTKELQDQSPNNQLKPQPTLSKLGSLKKLLRLKSTKQPKDTPLLNKQNGENGGDDIDNERRNDLRPSQVLPENNLSNSRFSTSDHFEVGLWENKKLRSRDGKLELTTECFLASIDQRSEKAAGTNACTVLATVIADWLHQNPKKLPLRCEFNKLIREGSAEWRKLCEDETHKDKFYDQHFDLDTVLQAKVRPISVLSDKSYVGFFMCDDMPENLHFLQDVMTFDSVWEVLDRNEATSEQIYIVGWNDHFFVLKIEDDAIYMIDTLGERLFEGCQNAYILKFNKESKLYEMKSEQAKENVESEESPKTEEEKVTTSHEVISEGKATCKEFIKGFLAALPISELQANLKRGLNCEAPHQLLQIEFHNTMPCAETIFQVCRDI
ncbi:hypothetical protein ACHQM5_021697 [Ranunculus cassubicifolius]